MRRMCGWGNRSIGYSRFAGEEGAATVGVKSKCVIGFGPDEPFRKFTRSKALSKATVLGTSFSHIYPALDIQKAWPPQPTSTRISVTCVAWPCLQGRRHITERGNHLRSRPVADDDDEKLKESIRSTIQTIYHPIATASMLPREEDGVMDNKPRFMALPIFEGLQFESMALQKCRPHSSSSR
ncbi:hypothetical protein BDZ89DRAFT_1040774 [Hymenopellis radicata]|nr:hypothetical protein BDZ89DRAFT_1040774 [Hymenopellis radicata]